MLGIPGQRRTVTIARLTKGLKMETELDLDAQREVLWQNYLAYSGSFPGSADWVRCRMWEQELAAFDAAHQKYQRIPMTNCWVCDNRAL